MSKKTVLAVAVTTSLVFATAGAFAAELKVLVSGAMAHALEEISKDFAKKNGHTLDFIVGTTGALQDRVRKGEKADVIEVTTVGMDALEKDQLVVPGTRVDLARANIGVAVRANAPMIDISTPDALKQRLLAARSIAYIDPVVGGQAGAAMVRLLRDLGITEQVKNKTVHGRTGAESVQKMINGEADIAISFISEILPLSGAKLVGPLPAALQNPSAYAGAIGIASANPAAARALLAAMQSAEAHHVMQEAGLEPIGH
jgi:molybdate transport system substrate-binding protein